MPVDFKVEHMLSSSFKSWVLIAACIFCPQAAFASSEVVMNDQMQGCFDFKSVKTTFNLTNGKYVSDKKLSFSREDLKELVKIIESSKSVSDLNPETIGITPELVKQHKNDLLKTTLPLEDPVYKKITPGDIKEFDYAAVCQSAKRKFFALDSCTTHIKIVVTIDDPTVSAEKIEISSIHNAGFMLPWKVKIGDRKWETYSTELPKKLSQISDKSGYCAKLLNGNYWQKDFWTDRIFWYSEVGYQLHNKNALEFAKLLPGHESLGSKYDFEDSFSGSMAFHPDSLVLQIKAKKPQLISSVHWWNHYKNCAPTADWSHLSGMVGTCEQMVNKQSWLVAWKNSSDKNSLRCNIDGFKLYDESNLNEYVVPAWRHAGMKGYPEVGIILLRGKETCGKVFLSKTESRALILEAKSAKGTHWFDKLNVDFHPKDPHYIIVQPTGKFERHMIARNSKFLPKWARNLTPEQISEYFDK